jgi:DNA-directed RNA polymerase specialized sigma24 family protein
MNQLSNEQREQATKLLPAVIALARRITRDEEYESLAQEILCDALLDYDATRGPLRPFILSRVRQRIIDALRRDGKCRPAGDMAHLVQEEPSQNPDDPILLLPKRHREIYRLSRQEGIGVETISKLVRKPRSYVRDVLADSDEYLKEVLT